MPKAGVEQKTDISKKKLKFNFHCFSCKDKREAVAEFLIKKDNRFRVTSSCPSENCNANLSTFTSAAKVRELLSGKKKKGSK